MFQSKSFEPPQKFYVPASESPSYRIAGGTQILIDALAQQLNVSYVQVNNKVTGIRETENQLTVETATGRTYQGDLVN